MKEFACIAEAVAHYVALGYETRDTDCEYLGHVTANRRIMINKTDGNAVTIRKSGFLYCQAFEFERQSIGYIPINND